MFKRMDPPSLRPAVTLTVLSKNRIEDDHAVRIIYFTVDANLLFIDPRKGRHRRPPPLRAERAERPEPFSLPWPPP